MEHFINVPCDWIFIHKGPLNRARMGCFILLTSFCYIDRCSYIKYVLCEWKKPESEWVGILCSVLLVWFKWYPNTHFRLQCQCYFLFVKCVLSSERWASLHGWMAECWISILNLGKINTSLFPLFNGLQHNFNCFIRFWGESLWWAMKTS